MSLKRYAEKRSFDKTPEPAPSEGSKSGAALQYCVQRHHATHLHYDLRLEAGVRSSPGRFPRVRRSTRAKSGSR